jgi:hypothetical protein
MRAKESLALLKNDLHFYDRVKKIIEDLSPLRDDPRKTREYINLHLFEDAQYIAKNKDNNDPVPRAVFRSLYIRAEVRNILKEDISFIFAYNLLSTFDNDYINLQTMQSSKLEELNGNAQQQVQELIRNYREDYPKENLADYLLEDDNKAFFESKKRELAQTDEWWLEAFNRAYALFDEMRLEMDVPFEAKKKVTQLQLDDVVMQQTVVEMEQYMTEHYDFQLNEDQLKKMKLLSAEIKDFVAGFYDGYSLQQEYEAMKEKMRVLEENNAKYEHKIVQFEKGMRGMSTGEQVLVVYYLFEKLGVTYENSMKKDWIKFIGTFTGKNEENIKKHLSFHFEDPQTQKNLRKVHDLFQDLFPNIAQKIQNDSESS